MLLRRWSIDVDGMSQGEMEAAYAAKMEETKAAKRAERAAVRALRLVRAPLLLLLHALGGRMDNEQIWKMQYIPSTTKL